MYKPELHLGGAACRQLCVLTILASFAGLGSATANDGSYLLLAPGASIEARFHGVCKRLTNLSLETQVYVPISDPHAWQGFDSRRNEAGLVVRVEPCQGIERQPPAGERD